MPTVSSLRELAIERIGGAEEVIDRFMSAVSAVTDEISGNIFYTRTRVKSVDSILNKVRVKRREPEREQYSIDEIGDIAGIRFVTLYDDQLPEVFAGIVNTIFSFSADFQNHELQEAKDHGSVSTIFDVAPLFHLTESSFPIRKIKVYRRKDNVADFYNDLAKKDWPDGIIPSRTALLNDKIIKEDNREDSYSSVHILTHAISYNLGIVKKVPLEIQIRTVAEDVWCEVSHSNKYKAKDLFFWSKEAAKDYGHIKVATSGLKTHVDGINESIRALRGYKKDIDKSIIDYYKDQSNSPTGSSVLDIANKMLGSESDNQELDKLFKKIVGRYGNVNFSNKDSLKTLFAHFERIIDFLNEACEQLVKSIDAEGNIVYNDQQDGITYSSYKNAKLFFQLEVIRLKVLVNETTAGKQEDFDWIELMRDIEKHEFEHAQFSSSVKNSIEFSGVNPRSLINYIKYLVSDHIEEMDDSFAYLSSAYELLQYDRTIHMNSILRLIIKREYALYIQGTTVAEESTLNNLNFRLSSRIENLKHKFTQSFLIASEVYQIHNHLTQVDSLRRDIGTLGSEAELYETNRVFVIAYLAAINYSSDEILFSRENIKKEDLHKSMQYIFEKIDEFENIEFNYLLTLTIYKYNIKNRKNASSLNGKLKKHLSELAKKLISRRQTSTELKREARKFLRGDE